MKRFLCFILVLVMPFSFFACKTDEGTYVYMPDGATALSLAYMMHTYQYIDGEKINYKVVPPALISSYALSGKADIIVLPANAAVNLYNKGAGYRLSAVLTHGNLFVVGQAAESLSDLKGKVVACIGQGAIPELVFKYILKVSGIEYVDSDTAVTDKVAITFMDEGADVIRLVKTGKADFGLLAEPAVTNAASNIPTNVLFDIQSLWKSITGEEGFPQAVLLIKDGTDKNIAAEFIRLVKEGDGWAALNPVAATSAIKSNALEGTESGIPNVSADIIDRCNIKTKTDGLKEYINGFLAAANSLDGIAITAPDDNFY